MVISTAYIDESSDVTSDISTRRPTSASTCFEDDVGAAGSEDDRSDVEEKKDGVECEE